MQIENGVVTRSKGSRLWLAGAGLLSVLLALPFLVSGLMDLGDESLLDLGFGLGACWVAARFFLMAGKRSRAPQALPALSAAAR
ncbi:MAG TPA: hypothetical protein VGE22_08990 [Solimonas sp.]